MTRTVEMLTEDKWVPVNFEELTEGDMFRMKEADGSTVIDEKGHRQFIAAGQPFTNENGVPTIRVLLT